MGRRRKLEGSVLDEVDKLIIEELIRDGRASYAELGRRLKLTRVSIKERVGRLVNLGIIEKFTVILSPERLGRNVSAFFEIEVEPQYLDEVARELAQEEVVENIYLMTGESTLHMHALLADMKDLERFVLERVYTKKGIVRVRTNVIMKRYKSRNGGFRL